MIADLGELIDYEQARAVQLRRWHEPDAADAEELVAWLIELRELLS